ncbi:MAG: 2-thiouracil desulfurase family protein [Gammaproteobacteria bacterium]|nr:2-thiouracil desulfurase family protein [Gammaproteobacteria bacterium]
MTRACRKRAKVAISRCLLGEKVSYDATHNFCSELSRFSENNFEVVAFCPEVETGMGVPRLPIRLSLDHGAIRACRVNDVCCDYTKQLSSYAANFVSTHPDLVAIINKKGSPSCGYLSTKLFDNETLVNAVSSGIFISEVLRLKPEILIIDEMNFMLSAERKAFLAAIKKALVKQGFF